MGILGFKIENSFQWLSLKFEISFTNRTISDMARDLETLAILHALAARLDSGLAPNWSGTVADRELSHKAASWLIREPINFY